jgi:hypothetical protein
VSDATPETEAAASESTPTDLLDNLRELGEALPVSFQPTASDAGPLLSGVIYYLATGSLQAPRVDVPNQAEVNAELAEQTRVNEAEAKVAELERKLAAQDAGPSPVAPAPVAAVPEQPASPAPPAAVEPAPTAPTEADSPAPIGEPAAGTPSAPVEPATGTVDPPSASPAPPSGTLGS